MKWTAMTLVIALPIGLSIYLGVTAYPVAFSFVFASVLIFVIQQLIIDWWRMKRNVWKRWEKILNFHMVLFGNLLFLGLIIGFCTYFSAPDNLEKGEDMPAVITAVVSLSTSWIAGNLFWIPRRNKTRKGFWKKYLKASS